MHLKEILQKIVENKDDILLCDSDRDWDANALLETLSDPILNLSAYFQPGMYIAEVNSGGYLGRVLYRVKSKS